MPVKCQTDCKDEAVRSILKLPHQNEAHINRSYN